MFDLCISNGNSFCLGAIGDPAVMTLPWLFRQYVPGLVNGWPAC